MPAARGPAEGRRLPRSRRITRGVEIRELFARGKRSGTASVDVFDSPSPAPFSRVGLVVPRHRQTAVARNRVKRRLREVVRLEVLPRLDGCGVVADVLVRAKREAYAASYGELRDQLVRWVERRCSRGRASS